MSQHIIHRGSVIEQNTVQGGIPDFLSYAWEADTASGVGDGNAVTTWTDSINSLDLAQSSPAAKPLYRADVNGYPAIDFDGTDDYLFTSDASLTALFNSPNGECPNITVFFVCSNRASAGAARWPYAAGSSASDNPIWSFNGTSTNESVYLRSDTAASVVTALSPASTSAKRVLTMDTTTARDYHTWINRTDNVTSTAPNGGFTINRFCIGGLLRTSFSNPSTIDVHGLYIMVGVATSDQRTAVWDYLTTKWGTP